MNNKRALKLIKTYLKFCIFKLYYENEFCKFFIKIFKTLIKTAQRTEIEKN